MMPIHDFPSRGNDLESRGGQWEVAGWTATAASTYDENSIFHDRPSHERIAAGPHTLL